MSKLVEIWWQNIRTNIKLISAFLTEIIITAIIITSYGIRSGSAFWDIMFFIWVNCNTSLFIILRLIGKGEVKDVEKKYQEEVEKNNELKQKAHYDQVIAAYAIQLAALKGQVPESIIANENWIDANELLKEEIKPPVIINENLNES